MAQIRAERDRLLAFGARCIGMTSSAAALACVSLPKAVPAPFYPVALIAIFALGFCQFRLASPNPVPWLVAVIALGDGLVAFVAVTGGTPNAAAASTITALAGGAAASTGVMLVTSRRRLVTLAVAYIVSAALTAIALAPLSNAAILVAFVSMGWLACGFIGVWLARALPRAMHRIGRLGEAYEAERRASDRDLRRRQDARLLHDTVLATLTLLAHSGVGVNAGALKEQARRDADLLRQLRLGSTPSPPASTSPARQPNEDSDLGDTLQSVKDRFRRMGLTVGWHGTGKVFLPKHVLDEFVLALGECLENVRRHSGVAEAQVTIMDDERTVRATVTDAGVGFDVSGIDGLKLGYSESIVARLKDIGGRARLFSSPGSGTTVVLEVPK